MKRRAILGAVLAASHGSGSARGQPTAGRVPRVAYLGVLGPTSLDPRQFEAINKGLVENGLIAGKNLVVEYHWAEGSPERLRELSAQLARSNVDVIVTAGPQSVRALVAAGARQPIVVAIVSDAVGAGLVKSLARPGGNVTGLSMSNTDLEGKRLEILREIVPAMTRVVVLHDPSMGDAGVAVARRAARDLGVEMSLADTADPTTFEAAFINAATFRADGISVMASPFFNFNRARLIELARRYRLPSIWEASIYVRQGGLASYGPSFADMYRRSAGYVARLLKGAAPGDLPVEQPTVFELFLNRNTAADLGIALSPALLARADEVIE